jgi:hypothetical protein
VQGNVINLLYNSHYWQGLEFNLVLLIAFRTNVGLGRKCLAGSNILAYFAGEKVFITLTPWAGVIKLVYHYQPMVLLSFCVMKQYNRSNYHRMTVTYHGKKFYNFVP